MEIKICGITDIEEIRVLNYIKPDYIGFVFAESKRKLTLEKAEKLYEQVDKGIKVVGVFRNNSKEFIEEVLREIPLYAVQLHGSEDEEFIEHFKKDCRVWKGESINSREDLKKALNLPVETLIVDSKNPGSGKVFPWEYLKDIKSDKMIFLAGGINENNIDEALEIKNIQGVDISSGVESIKEGLRRKSPEKIRNIMKKVREKYER